MKIKVGDLVKLYVLLTDVEKLNGKKCGEKFAAHLSRFRIYSTQEVQIWNGLNEAQRLEIMNEEIELPISKIKAKDLPPDLPPYGGDTLALIVNGKLPAIPDRPQLARLLDERKTQKLQPKVKKNAQ